MIFLIRRSLALGKEDLLNLEFNIQSLFDFVEGLFGFEIESHVSGGDLLVELGDSVNSSFHEIFILSVKLNLEESGSVNSASDSLAGDMGGGKHVFEGSIEDWGEAESSGSLLGESGSVPLGGDFSLNHKEHLLFELFL